MTREITRKFEITREIKRRNRRERKDDAAEERRVNGNRGKREKPEDVKKRGVGEREDVRKGAESWEREKEKN